MPAIKLRNNNVHTLNPVVSSFSPLYALYTLIVIGIHQINGIKHQPIPIVEIKHKIKAANFIGTPFINSFSFYPPLDFVNKEMEFVIFITCKSSYV